MVGIQFYEKKRPFEKKDKSLKNVKKCERFEGKFLGHLTRIRRPWKSFFVLTAALFQPLSGYITNSISVYGILFVLLHQKKGNRKQKYMTFI